MRLPFLMLAAVAAIGHAADPDIVVTGRIWAPFISPMGEPYRAKSTAEDTMANWFARADADRNGWLTLREMEADAARFFDRLDLNSDGSLVPEEIVNYEWEVAPEIQVNAKPRRVPGSPPVTTKREDKFRPKPDRGLQGAARYALINLPQPVAAADFDFNRAVSRAEFNKAAAQRFALLDIHQRGQVPYSDLVALRSQLLAEAAKRAKRRVKDDEEDDVRVATPL